MRSRSGRAAAGNACRAWLAQPSGTGRRAWCLSSAKPSAVSTSGAGADAKRTRARSSAVKRTTVAGRSASAPKPAVSLLPLIAPFVMPKVRMLAEVLPAGLHTWPFGQARKVLRAYPRHW
jgi:hypothetical protein